MRTPVAWATSAISSTSRPRSIGHGSRNVARPRSRSSSMRSTHRLACSRRAARSAGPSADAIVVLAGSIPTRVLEAADLYRTGLAARVVVTRERLARGESVLRVRGVHIPESDELTIAALEQLGVPAHAIVRLRRRAR